jgi:hypothetical protein
MTPAASTSILTDQLIYLDHQATTPVDPRVVDAMLPKHKRKPEAGTRRYWIVTLDWQGNDSGYALAAWLFTLAARLADAFVPLDRIGCQVHLVEPSRRVRPTRSLPSSARHLVVASQPVAR